MKELNIIKISEYANNDKFSGYYLTTKENLGWFKTGFQWRWYVRTIKKIKKRNIDMMKQFWTQARTENESLWREVRVLTDKLLWLLVKCPPPSLYTNKKSKLTSELVTKKVWVKAGELRWMYSKKECSATSPYTHNVVSTCIRRLYDVATSYRSLINVTTRSCVYWVA